MTGGGVASVLVVEESPSPLDMTMESLGIPGRLISDSGMSCWQGCAALGRMLLVRESLTPRGRVSQISRPFIYHVIFH